MIIGNKYKLLNLIGSGLFGTIYKGENINTGETVAIKVEPLNNSTKLLKNETKVYHYLNFNCNKKKDVGIPKVKWFGVDDENYYMVIELLGPSLQSIKEERESFSLKTIIELGIQLIRRVEFLHNLGLIHRDIKPDNFLLGIGLNKNTIYMIDFGFCKKYEQDDDVGKYKNDNGKSNIDCKEYSDQLSRTHKKRESIIGTPNYVSINVHKYNDPERKDDLESVCYMLLYFYLGKLPWDLPNITNEQILEMKIDLITEEKQKEIIPSFFLKLIFLVQNTQGKPKYNELVNILFESLSNVYNK